MKMSEKNKIKEEHLEKVNFLHLGNFQVHTYVHIMYVCMYVHYKIHSTSTGYVHKLKSLIKHACFEISKAN